MSKDQGIAFDWDDGVVNDSPSFITFERGRYQGKVKSFKRGRREASENMCACPKAMVEIEFENENGDKVVVKDDIFLHSKFAWKIEKFHMALPQGKDHTRGDTVKMNWNEVIGEIITCDLTIEAYSTRDDKQKAKDEGKPAEKSGRINNIKEYLPTGTKLEESKASADYEFDPF